MPYRPGYEPPPTPEQEAAELAPSQLHAWLDAFHRPPAGNGETEDEPWNIPRKLWSAWWRDLRRDNPTAAAIYALADTVDELRQSVDRLAEQVHADHLDTLGPL